MSLPRPLLIGISSCLLGAKVRFDGQHKRDAYLQKTVGRFVQYLPVCPEVEIGMGIPRETVRLVEGKDGPRMIAPKSGQDFTAKMREYSARKAEELAAMDLSGYIFKKDSPSCGLHRVRLYREGGMPERTARGLFAAALVERLPLLPVEEEGRLRDPRLRENFFERVFAWRRLRVLFSEGWTNGELVRFHTAEKLLLMAHSQKHYRELGRLVARVKDLDRAELETRYRELYMKGMARLATPRSHANVLQHMAGYLRDAVDERARRELLSVIEDFRHELVPLVVPITLIRHHVMLHGIEYLAGQHYLDPHPKELMLRNHV